MNKPNLPITIDSRVSKAGLFFVASSGSLKNSLNGHDFIQQAIKNNCSGLIIETTDCLRLKLPTDIPVWYARNSKIAASILAEKSAGNPSKKISLCGITGTNGKTTTSFFLSSMVQNFKKKIGIIGTLGIGSRTKLKPCKFTTPEAEHISTFLSQLVKKKYDQVIMEVSSHAIATKRVEGLAFEIAALTNITQDHLDFHENLDNYTQTKFRLFKELLSKNGTAVIPETFIRKKKFNIKQKIITWGYSKTADIQASQIQNIRSGISYKLRIRNFETIIESKIHGIFNLDNMLCATGIAMALGISNDAIVLGIKKTTLPEGRLQEISKSLKPAVFIDFAHTPDAIEMVLKSLRKLCQNKLAIIFGCGGDRDRKKRPLMTQAAMKYADKIFATQDNPRQENPSRIIDDMQLPKSAYVIYDRKSAIEFAINDADDGDVILIAGKGHEKIQQIGNEAKPFNDAKIAYQVLLNRHKNSAQK